MDEKELDERTHHVSCISRDAGYQRYHTYGTGIKDGGSIIISGG